MRIKVDAKAPTSAERDAIAAILRVIEVAWRLRKEVSSLHAQVKARDLQDKLW